MRCANYSGQIIGEKGTTGKACPTAGGKTTKNPVALCWKKWRICGDCALQLFPSQYPNGCHSRGGQAAKNNSLKAIFLI